MNGRSGPRALVLGGHGQTGSYLVEHLRADGYEVSAPTSEQLDVRDYLALLGHVEDFRPHEVYNLAAATTPGANWNVGLPDRIVETTGVGAVKALLAAQRLDRGPGVRFVHASSSAIYDPLHYGPYGAAKLLAHDAVWGFRVDRGMHASSAILYSHTSVRQSRRFLLRRIVRWAAEIGLGRREAMWLNDLEARRDWGWARDYAHAMMIMGRRDAPGDCGVYTGEQHSVRELVEVALAVAGAREPTAERWVRNPDEDCEPCRPKPYEEITPPVSAAWPRGWEPTKSFEDMIAEMVHHDIAELTR